MPDVSLTQHTSSTGTTTPATTGSLTTVAGDLLIAFYVVVGTNPTLTTPAAYGQINKTQGANVSVGMYVKTNIAGGAENPSSTLGGTVTGWIAGLLEFNQMSGQVNFWQRNMIANTALAQLGDIFSGVGTTATVPDLLFVYGVGNVAATLTAQNSGLAPQNGGEMWSSSVEGQTANGATMNLFWGSNLAKGPGSWPVGKGTLASGVDSVQIAVVYPSKASQSYNGTSEGGSSGLYVGPQYQGITGG